MAGTKAGGLHARETLLAKYGESYYINLGKQGGTATHNAPRGFAANRELAAAAGYKGGKISKRPKRSE